MAGVRPLPGTTARGSKLLLRWPPTCRRCCHGFRPRDKLQMLSREASPCRCVCRQRGPRRPDAQQSAKITEQSVRRYQEAIRPFAECLHEIFPALQGAEDFDDALVEWKQSAPVSKANFELAVAGVEHLFSKFRKNLPWAHDVLKGWAVQHTARHTIPMSKAHTTLYAVHFSILGAG